MPNTFYSDYLDSVPPCFPVSGRIPSHLTVSSVSMSQFGVYGRVWNLKGVFSSWGFSS